MQGNCEGAQWPAFVRSLGVEMPPSQCLILVMAQQQLFAWPEGLPSDLSIIWIDNLYVYAAANETGMKITPHVSAMAQPSELLLASPGHATEASSMALRLLLFGPAAFGSGGTTLGDDFTASKYPKISGFVGYTAEGCIRVLLSWTATSDTNCTTTVGDLFRCSDAVIRLEATKMS
jgi:hypothetical protein